MLREKSSSSGSFKDPKHAMIQVYNCPLEIFYSVTLSTLTQSWIIITQVIITKWYNFYEFASTLVKLLRGLSKVAPLAVSLFWNILIKACSGANRNKYGSTHTCCGLEVLHYHFIIFSQVIHILQSSLEFTFWSAMGQKD